MFKLIQTCNPELYVQAFDKHSKVLVDLLLMIFPPLKHDIDSFVVS